jgi:hypothetical protein
MRFGISLPAFADFSDPRARARIPDGISFTEILTGRTLTVQEGYLP